MDVTLFRVVLCLILCFSWIFAFTNWRTAVFGLILWDAVRDPLRKLAYSDQLLLTFFGLSLWAIILLSCLKENRSQLRQFRSILLPFVGVAIFVVIGFHSAVNHDVPSSVVFLGLTSYLFPFVGYPIGVVLGRDQRQVAHLLSLYCIVNVLFVSTAVAEVVGVKSQMIGGFFMEWHRVTGASSIPLPSGTYRSPDILGLHAAHILVFSILLWRRDHTEIRKLTAGTIGIVAAALLLFSARRKMLGLSLVFFMVWILFSAIHQKTKVGCMLRSLRQPFILFPMMGIVICVFALTFLLPVHARYAASLFVDAPARIWMSILESPATTIRQSGYWGTGLGAATQGNSTISVGFSGGWQEDGISRLFREGGAVGALAIVLTGLIFLFNQTSTIKTILDARTEKSLPLQAGIWALVLANTGCLVISHQHLSGDPYFGAFLAMIVGFSNNGPTGELHE